MKYILIHFGSEGKRVYVNGFIVPKAKNNSDALEQVAVELKKGIESLIKKAQGDKDHVHYDSVYGGKISRLKEFLYSIEHPNEINDRGDVLVEIIDVETPVNCGYWLEDAATGKNLCNIMKKQRV